MTSYRPIRDEALITRDLPRDYVDAARQATRNIEHAVNSLMDEFERDLAARLDTLKSDVDVSGEIQDYLDTQMAETKGELKILAGDLNAWIDELATVDENASAELNAKVKSLKDATAALAAVLDENKALAKKLGRTVVDVGIKLVKTAIIPGL